MAGRLAGWHPRSRDGWGDRLAWRWGLGHEITSLTTRDFLIKVFIASTVPKVARRTVRGSNIAQSARGRHVALVSTQPPSRQLL